MIGSEKAFTLVELLAVMVIASVVMAVTMKKISTVSLEARQIALTAGVSELNGRERLQFLLVQIADGWQDDATLYAAVDKTLGTKYSWSSIGQDGGTLQFNGISQTLVRTHSMKDAAGRWQ